MTDSAHHAVATYPVRMRMDEHDVGRSTTLGQTVLSRDDRRSAEHAAREGAANAFNPGGPRVRRTHAYFV